MKRRKALLAATVAAATLLALPHAAQAQGGDPILRFLNSVFPNAEFRSTNGGRNWNDDDDDDDGGSGNRWDDDDDDGRSGGRDDDDDDGGGRDDNDDDD